MDSNLSEVSTDSKANPGFIKPKRQEIPIARTTTSVSMVRIITLRSPCRAQCATWSRMRVSASSWLEILDVARVILCGDDRFILCADDHLSASFARLYAIGQIAKQLIFVSIAPQKSIPVRRNRRSCNHVLPLCVLRSLVDCFRMSVRYLSQTRSTLLTVSSREVIYGRNICWE